MQFSLFNLMMYRDNPGGVAGVIRDTCELVEDAERLGFDTAWFAEHHFTNYSLCVSPLMMAAHMAGRTTRIRLGPCVVVLPLHNPLRAAQEIALLDQISDGRAVLGLGSGYQPYEFERFGVDLARKSEIFLDHWEVMRAALVDGRVQHDGVHSKIPETTVAVRPRQKPLPPLFLTSIQPDILARLAGDGAIPFVSGGQWGRSEERVASRDRALSTWARCGFDPATMPVGMMQYIAVVDSPAEAIEAAERARYYARMVYALRAPSLDVHDGMLSPAPIPGEPDLESFCKNYCIGDKYQVAARLIEDIKSIDPIHYNCLFQFGDMPVAQARRSMERFATDVLPLVERELGPLDGIGLRQPVRALADHAA